MTKHQLQRKKQTRKNLQLKAVVLIYIESVEEESVKEEEEEEEEEEEGVEEERKRRKKRGGKERKELFLLAQRELSEEFRFRQNQPRAISKRTNLKKNSSTNRHLMLLSLLS